MPIRSDRTAPLFDKARPREFTRFFKDLEILFERANVNQEADKKKYVLHYVDFETEQVWRWIPAFSDTIKTYADFKDEILGFYPEVSEHIYSISNIQALISNRQQLGISTVSDLQDFHFQFLTITQWLINRRHLCDLEQRRSYIQAFPPTLLQSVLSRLQLKSPDRHPDIPYPITDIYEAAQFILLYNSTSDAPVQSAYQSSSVEQATTLTEPSLYAEKLISLVSKFTDVADKVISQFNRNSLGQCSGLGQRPKQVKILSRQSVNDRIAEIELEIATLKSQESPDLTAYYPPSPTASTEYFGESEYALTGPGNIGHPTDANRLDLPPDTEEIDFPVVSCFAVAISHNSTPLQSSNASTDSDIPFPPLPDRHVKPLAITRHALAPAVADALKQYPVASIIGKSPISLQVTLHVKISYYQLQFCQEFINLRHDAEKAIDDRFVGG